MRVALAGLTIAIKLNISGRSGPRAAGLIITAGLARQHAAGDTAGWEDVISSNEA